MVLLIDKVLLQYGVGPFLLKGEKMLLKTYLVTIGIFWIALLIVSQIIKIQLKRDGLFERMKEYNKTESLINKIRDTSGRIVLSIIPVANITMAGYMFVRIDAIYASARRKIVARKLSEAFEKTMNAAEDSLKEKSV